MYIYFSWGKTKVGTVKLVEKEGRSFNCLKTEEGQEEGPFNR